MFSRPEPFILAELDYRREKITADLAGTSGSRRVRAARPLHVGRRHRR